MILRRLEVRNFRKLIGPVVIDGVGDGLTVIAGSNENGKSTLLDALRCAFFNRHTLGGKEALRLQPYGHSVRPEITVDFEFDGDTYNLRKAFCQRPEAELTTTNGVLTGNAAEDKLTELLRFTRPGSGAAKEDHHGVWGLFWLTQGRALDATVLNQDARTSVHSAIESEVGQVLGGRRGTELLNNIEKQFKQFYKNKNNPAGVYAESISSVEELESRRSVIAKKLEEYQRELGELNASQSRVERYQAQLPEADHRLSAAQHAKGEMVELIARIEEIQREEKAAKLSLQLASQKVDQRNEAIRRLTTAEQSLYAVEEQIKAARDTAGPLEKQENTKGQLKQGSTNDLRAAELEVQASLELVERISARESLKKLDDRLQAADAEDKEAKRLSTAAAALAIDKSDIEELQRLERNLSSAQAKLEVAATEVRVSCVDGSTAYVDGEALTKPWVSHVTHRTEISIPQVVTIALIPSGDTDTLNAAHQVAVNAIDAFLRKRSIKDIQEARDRYDKKSLLLEESKRRQAIALIHAAEGIEVLRVEVAKLTTKLAEASADDESALSLREGSEALQFARGRLEECKKVSRKIDEEYELLVAQVHAVQDRIKELEGQKVSDLRSVSSLSGELDRGRLVESDEMLGTQLAQAERAYEAAGRAACLAQADLQRVNVEIVNLELEAATGVHANLRRHMEMDQRRCHDLRLILSTKGQVGYGEELQRLDGELEGAQVLAVQIEHRAKATALLLKTLQEAQETARETYLRPVAERVKPYLDILLPGAELALDENFQVIGLKRDGYEEMLSSLSIGTQEQIAILVRLAFADLLRDHGQRASVVLDDAIVYADHDRFDRMLLILRRAARNSQVLVLTCRERDYENLGAPIIRLTEQRATELAFAGDV
jgi:hypothetical protein